ncbi:MAG TPA: helix-turn-helix domain-containing protein [Acidimicrobiales bacterium]|nr:helix-turn-helix domain-containing protein [Acidimicrobiales bacterium]
MAREQAHGEEVPGPRPTLGEETRAVVRSRIVHGAAIALAERGFAATVDDIAAAAGVSRRTVFRHFATHDEVLAAAVAEMLARYDRLVPGPPGPGVELETWLRDTAVTLHDLNTRLMGQAFWDMNVERPGMTPAERHRRRIGYATQIAHHAWRAAHGPGRPPSWVVDAFAMQLSGFATNCLCDYPAEKAGRVSARVLGVVLAAALSEERG